MTVQTWCYKFVGETPGQLGQIGAIAVVRERARVADDLAESMRRY
jgi:hypothetical protein